MGEEVIQTDVDRLIDILKTKKKLEVRQAAKELKLSEETIQQWVDFLVEERIIAIDYEFTKPYISLVKNIKEDVDKETDLENYKKRFREYSNKNKNSEIVWKNHMLENLEFMKPFFYSEADNKGLDNADQLWEEYKDKVKKL